MKLPRRRFLHLGQRALPRSSLVTVRIGAGKFGPVR